jgi:hypothetical protein
MSLSEILLVAQLVISVVLAVVTVRQARVTSDLEQRVHRLNTSLDQAIQRLHRAREAVIQQHKAHVFLVEYKRVLDQRGIELTETYFDMFAEWSAYAAELRGLAFAIGDKELLEIVNKEDRDSEGVPPEIPVRARSQQLHARISQLLDEATAEARKAQPRSWLRWLGLPGTKQEAEV